MSAFSEFLTSLSSAQRVVIKIGSALLVDAQTGEASDDWLKGLADDIADMQARGTQVLIVSSGAIALGRRRLGLTGKALPLDQKQACAAAGQSRLTQCYEDVLSPHGIVTAQALLTLMDTEDRRRWLNARGTLETLLSLGAVPIINENDTVATDEIRYGDNDRLAARAAQMVGADTLILLSDIDGLYSADPRSDKTAKHLPVIDAITPDVIAMGGAANAGANVGTGGMATKIAAARIAVSAGCHVGITRGDVERPIKALLSGAKASWFRANSDPVAARKQWILGGLSVTGAVHIDNGAERALRAGKSLLPAGITRCEGAFTQGDAISVLGPKGVIIARGLAAYSSLDTQKILGKNSDDIEGLLGYSRGAALIHRDDLVLIT